jgi:hypothetical protein
MVPFWFVMIEKYIQYCRVWLPNSVDPEREAALKDRIPRRSARRMSQLGKVAYWLLDGCSPTAEDAIVYGSTYAENRALGKYISGLPDAASPTMFQTSIHPSAVQQALIAKGQPLRTLIPMPGTAEGILEKLCYVALHRPESRTFVLLAEEAGDSLVEYGLAADCTWGIALCVSSVRTADTLGSVAWSDGDDAGDYLTGLAWAEWLGGQQGNRSGNLPGGGQIRWHWHDEC